MSKEQFIKFSEQRGLAQHISIEDLDPKYCHVLVNLDVDDPVGRLSLRSGWTLKQSDTLTSILSSYEYRFDKSSETIHLFNDNGTLRYYKDGVLQSNPTLPTGATLESGFRNQYFGYKNGIIITTGNGSTNYVLGFYYTKRLTSENDGLFGNVLNDTGTYRLLKSQIIFESGQFSKIYNVIQVGNYYYFSFQNSKWIEKRNSDYQLVDRFVAHPDAADKTTVALATDGTYIYVGTEDGVYKIDPNGWNVLDSNTTTLTDVLGVAVDADYLWAIGANDIYRFTITDFSSESHQTHTATFVSITCEPSSGGAIYLLTTNQLERYAKTDFSDGNETHTASLAALGSIYEIKYDNTNDYVIGTGWDGSDGITRRWADSDLSIIDTNTLTNGAPRNILPDFKIVDRIKGAVYPFDSSTPAYPSFLFNLTLGTIAAGGNIDNGTVFYKIAIEDVDGQIFISSDPVTFTTDVSNNKIDVNIVCTENITDSIYRIKYIHLYRAYNSLDDAELPGTNYRLLKTIDINDTGWTHDTDLNIYYYQHTDDVSETSIGDTTYQEMSEIEETVKPRYLNYKYLTWLNNQLHGANFYLDEIDYKNTIVKSATNGPEAVSLGTSNFYDYEIGDGDTILGISNSYSRSVVWKNRKAAIFYDGTIEKLYSDGLAYSGSFVKNGDDIWFIGQKGLYHISNGEFIRISDPISIYFDAISSFTYANVFFFDDKNRVLFSVPGTRAFLYNVLYKTWTTYDTNYAFRGFFKNYVNEYIGFNGTRFGKVFDGSATDNDSNITISYESPIIKIGQQNGLAAALTREDYIASLISKTGTYSLVLYKWYTASNKAAIDTHTMIDPTSTSIGHKSHFLNNCWGTMFSWALSGSGTVFVLSSLSIGANVGGVVSE